MRRKILSTILALCMVMSMLPMTAFAAVDAGKADVESITVGGETANLVANPEDGSTFDKAIERTIEVAAGTTAEDIVLTVASDATVKYSTTATDAAGIDQVGDNTTIPGTVTIAKEDLSQAVTYYFEVTGVAGSNEGDEAPVAYYKLTVTVAADQQKTAIESVSITGTAKVGETLTATVTPTDATVTYQWKADNVDISGATAETYEPVAGDVGKTITVAVTGTGDYEGTKTSDPTDAVAEADQPSTDPAATATGEVNVDIDKAATGTITVTLTNDTFEAAANKDSFTVKVDETTLTVGGATITGAADDGTGDKVKAELTVTGTDVTATEQSTVSVEIAADALTTSTEALTADATAVTVTVETDPNAPAAAATGEVTVDADKAATGTITVTLTNDTFEAAADKDSFTVKVGDTALTVEEATFANAAGDEEGAKDKATLTVTGTNVTATADSKVSVVIANAALTTSTENLTATSTVTVTVSGAEESDDASLLKVLDQNITAAGGDGSAADKAKTATITVPYDTAKLVAETGIVVAEGATAKLCAVAAFDPEVAEIELAATTHAYILVTAADGETVCYYDVTINKEAPDDDASLTAVTVAGTNATLDEATKTFAAKLPADADLTSATVVLKVPATASVSYVVAATKPADAEGYTTEVPSGHNGTVTLDEQDLSTNSMFVLVTAQDGETTAEYVITAEKTDISLGEPLDVEPIVDSSITGADRTAVDNALAGTALDDGTVLQQAAFEKVADVATDKNSAITELEKLDGIANLKVEDVFFYAVPSLELEVKPIVDNDGVKTYVVDITPYVQLVASTAKIAAAVELGDTGTNAVPIGQKQSLASDLNDVDVTIGVPTFIAADNKYVNVVHGTDTHFKKVDSGTVTITVPHFSEFKVTAATKAALSNLAISEGTLTPAFNAATTAYTAEVGKDVESITVTPTAAADFNITVNGTSVASGDASAPIALETGKNTITVVVSDKSAASDKLADTTYTIEVTRAGGGGGGGGTGGGGGGGVSSNVTIDKATNGKVTVTPTAPSKGSTVTITLTPDTGYVVGTVTVTDKDGKAVELTKVSDTKYTFTMPDGKVKVAATFTKVADGGFTDVAADAYYADAVKWAVDKGITNGLTATTFGPNNSCTRGQMVTFLWRAAGSPKASATNSFTDVASGEYYYDAVLWAVEKGITNGTTATTFSPNATVNRGQTVTFLYRYAGSPAATGTTSFTDVAADAYYANAVKWAVAEEITNGTSSTTFAPASNCTRGQIVTFLYRQIAE